MADTLTLPKPIPNCSANVKKEILFKFIHDTWKAEAIEFFCKDGGGRKVIFDANKNDEFAASGCERCVNHNKSNTERG